KLLLENFNGAVEVGVFNQAYKLYVIAISFISALTSVLMPKMSKYYTTGDTERLKKYLNFSLRFISGLALPMTIGVLVMAPQFVSWFLGEEFSEVMNPLVIISFSFVFKGLSDVIGIQYLVVSNKNKEYALAVIVGAVMTSSCCFLFLQLNFKAQAPALALFVGTAVTLLIELYQVRKVVSFMFVGKYLIKYAVFSLIMGGCMWGASRSIEIEHTSLYLVTQVGVGVISYSICFILSKDPLIQLIKRKKREI
ncbi:MAG: oligosaccharide flippase family protein, partial [Carnobacterium sp.]